MALLPPSPQATWTVRRDDRFGNGRAQYFLKECNAVYGVPWYFGRRWGYRDRAGVQWPGGDIYVGKVVTQVSTNGKALMHCLFLRCRNWGWCPLSKLYGLKTEN